MATPTIITGSKPGAWSAARVTTAFKKNEFADLGGGSGLSLTGAARRWKGEFRASKANPTVFNFTHYFGFPTPYAPEEPGVIAGLRTAGKVEDFLNQFDNIYKEYGKDVTVNMAANKFPNDGLGGAMNGIIAALSNVGYKFLENVPADELGQRKHNQKAWLLYTAFTPLTVNVELKPEKTAAVQTPVSLFRGGADKPFGLLDITQPFLSLEAFEAAARKATAGTKPTNEIQGDPFYVLSQIASISMKNVQEVTGTTNAGGIEVSTKVPPKGAASKIEEFRNLYNSYVKDGKYMIVANIVDKKPVGFEMTPEGRIIHKTKSDLPGSKVIGEYVYFADSNGVLGHLLARTTNPNWASHMALAARTLSGDNAITAEQVMKVYAQPASRLAAERIKGTAAAAMTYQPGVSTSAPGVSASARGAVALTSVPTVASPTRTGLVGSNAFPSLLK